MKSVMTEAAFQQTTNLIKSKVGNYISKELYKAELQGTYTAVYYKVKYTEESEVTVRVVFPNRKRTLRLWALVRFAKTT